MDISLVVAHGNGTAVGNWRRQAAVSQLVVLPGVAAVFTAVGCNFTFVVGDEYKTLVHRHAHIGRGWLAPVRRAGDGVETGHAALVGHGAHIFFQDHRGAGDVGDAFQLGGAARFADHHL